MRTRLTKILTIRVAPFLKFHIDEGLKKELAVLDAIRKAREEDEARAAATHQQQEQHEEQAKPE
jgi:hypothetical protein